jgi:hypothetical protein
MDSIREACDISIRRACGFGALAIGTAMLGLSYYPLLAVRFGAILTSIMIAVLLIKALRAPWRPYRRTEAWLILGKRHGLPESRAQQVFGSTLRERYLWHATVAAAVALPMAAVGIFQALVGDGPLPLVLS